MGGGGAQRTFFIFKLALLANRDANVKRPCMSILTGLIFVVNIAGRNYIVVLSGLQKTLLVMVNNEWFEDNVQTLTPLTNAKDAAYNRMLSSGARRVAAGGQEGS